MSGTDDQILGEARNEDNIGDSVCTPASMAQVEARIHDLMQRATGGGAANHIDNRRRLMCQMFYFAANIGTGSREYWMGKTISWTDRGNAARTAQGEAIWDVVLGNPHAVGAMNEPFPRSMKAYLRSRGTLTYKLFKKNPERLVRSTRMGLPENYRYLAADWFDGLHGLSPEEQGAIDCAKQVGLFRSARANKLSTASHYTSGTMEGTSGHIQANAGNLVLRN